MTELTLDCGHKVWLKHGVIVQGIVCRQCVPPHYDNHSYEVGRDP